MSLWLMVALVSLWFAKSLMSLEVAKASAQKFGDWGCFGNLRLPLLLEQIFRLRYFSNLVILLRGILELF